MPNLQPASFLSETLDRVVSLRLTTNGIRTIEHKGGLDAFLEKTTNTALAPKLLQLKKQLLKAKALKAGTPA